MTRESREDTSVSDRRVPKVTVGVLVHDGREHLPAVAQAILSLDYPNYEVVAVDNDSNDGSADLLSSLDSEFEEFHSVELDANRGCSAGKNAVVERSSGEYVLLLDDDILLRDSGVLTSLLDQYERASDPGLVSLALINEGESRSIHYGIYPDVVHFSYVGANPRWGNPALPPREVESLHGTEIAAPNGGAMFFEKDVWEDVGGLDETQPYNLDDFDIGARAWLFGYRNYLHSRSIQRHLGAGEREDLDGFKWRFRYYYSGRAITVLKNYGVRNALPAISVASLISLGKAVKRTVEYRDPTIPLLFVRSALSVLRALPSVVDRRRSIQANRETDADRFLTVESPESRRTE